MYAGDGVAHLFRLADDFSESTDLAEEHPDVVQRLVERWWQEAGRNQVLPLEDGFTARAVAIEPNPWPSPGHRVLRPGGGGVAEDLLGPLGAGFRVRALVHGVEGPDASGMLCALGDWSNGWALYLLDGRPTAAFNLFGRLTRLAGDAEAVPGEHCVGLDYERTGDDRVLRLLLDDEPQAEAHLAEDLPFRWQIGGAGLLVGRDAGFPVCDDYEPPFAPAGFSLSQITIDYPILGSHPPAAEELLQALRFE